MILYAITYTFLERLYSGKIKSSFQNEFIKACNNDKKSFFKKLANIKFEENNNWIKNLKDQITLMDTKYTKVISTKLLGNHCICFVYQS